MSQTEAYLRQLYPKGHKSFLRGELARLESTLMHNEELVVGIGATSRLYVTTHRLIVSSATLLALQRDAVESIGLGAPSTMWSALRGVPGPVYVLTKSGQQYGADSAKGQSPEEFLHWANGWLAGTSQWSGNATEGLGKPEQWASNPGIVEAQSRSIGSLPAEPTTEANLSFNGAVHDIVCDLIVRDGKWDVVGTRFYRSDPSSQQVDCVLSLRRKGC